MNLPTSRRHFLKTTATTGALWAFGDLSFLSQLPAISRADARLDPKAVRLQPEIEPLVRLLEDTPRERLLEKVAARIKQGLNYRELLAALLLAGVRNIQPRPVGFKFHAVLVVNSAHLASIASPDSERWLPIFWALDYFKESQARDVREGDWTMAPVNESAVPPAAKARKAFTEAMDNWDEAAADAAVAGLVRTARSGTICLRFFAAMGLVISVISATRPSTWPTVGVRCNTLAGSMPSRFCVLWPMPCSITKARIRPSGMLSRIVPGDATRHGSRRIRDGLAAGQAQRGSLRRAVSDLARRIERRGVRRGCGATQSRRRAAIHLGCSFPRSRRIADARAGSGGAARGHLHQRPPFCLPDQRER